MDALTSPGRLGNCPYVNMMTCLVGGHLWGPVFSETGHSHLCLYVRKLLLLERALLLADDRGQGTPGVSRHDGPTPPGLARCFSGREIFRRQLKMVPHGAYGV